MKELGERVEKFVFCETCQDGRHLETVDRSEPGAQQIHTDILTAIYECQACQRRGTLFKNTETGEEWCEGAIRLVENL